MIIIRDLVLDRVVAVLVNDLCVSVFFMNNAIGFPACTAILAESYLKLPHDIKLP